MVKWRSLAVLALVNRCCGVIYNLNDTEYDRMPPLSALDEYERCRRGGSPYCVARFDLVADPSNELYNMIQEYSAYKAKHFNHTYIDRGICIIESCQKYADKSEDLNVVIEACVNDTIRQKYGIQAKLSKVFSCYEPKSEISIDWLDWMVAAIITALIAINLIGTIYDVFSSKTVEDTNYLLSFSIVRNWRSLVSQPVTNDLYAERLNALYGVKAVIMMLTIVVHMLQVYAGPFTDNPHYYEKAYDNPFHFLGVNGLTIVQIFFGISGFLLTYKLELASEDRTITLSMLPKILLMRWLRLTPAYALILGFTATWFRHLNSGPIWDMFIGESCRQCRRIWWKHLLYIQNYEPSDHFSFCLLTAWHVAADTQLFVIGLVVYMVTSRRARYLGIGLMLAVGVVAPALHMWLYDLEPVVLLSPETFRSFYNRTFHRLHIRVETNLSCYAIGMLAGYKVYDWQKRGLELPKKKILSVLSALVVPALCAVFYSGRVFYEPYQVPYAISILYAMLLRVFFGVIIAYGVVIFVLKTEDNLREIFKWRGFLPLGRLSYMVYLLNMDFVLALTAQRTQLKHVSLYDAVLTYLGLTTLLFLVAVPYHLLVEAPINQLLKNMTSRSNGEDIQKKTL